MDEPARILSYVYNTARSFGTVCVLDATWGLIRASNSTLHQHFTCTSQPAILPPSLASVVNSILVPPGFLASENLTYLHCNGIASCLNSVINNVTFLINAVDLKMHASQSLCIGSVMADSDGH